MHQGGEWKGIFAENKFSYKRRSVKGIDVKNRRAYSYFVDTLNIKIQKVAI